MPTIGTQTEHHGTYCGMKPNIPTASPGTCFLKGKKVGFVAGLQKGLEKGRRKGRVMTELTRQSTIKNVANEIQNKGLIYLKRHLHIDHLNKDELRSIIVRMTGTAQAVPRYSSLSKDQLRQALLDRGFQR